MIRESEISFYVNNYNSYRQNIMQLTAKVDFPRLPHE